jgi:aryl-alcohol dehydrogenase-like predicted oxidoreductase
MSQYSILDRRPEEEILPLLAEHGISLIARGPLAGGILSENGRSKAEKKYLDYSSEELLQLHDQLTQETSDSHTLAQTALHYPLGHPSVAVIIPGASSLEQLKNNVAAAKLDPLPSEKIEMIRGLSKANRYTLHL